MAREKKTPLSPDVPAFKPRGKGTGPILGRYGGRGNGPQKPVKTLMIGDHLYQAPRGYGFIKMDEMDARYSKGHSMGRTGPRQRPPPFMNFPDCYGPGPIPMGNPFFPTPSHENLYPGFGRFFPPNAHDAHYLAYSYSDDFDDLCRVPPIQMMPLRWSKSHRGKKINSPPGFDKKSKDYERKTRPKTPPPKKKKKHDKRWLEWVCPKCTETTWLRKK